jgi:hypothetical protein
LRFDASAWTASTQWTVALVLAVLAGAGWLVARAVGRLVLVVTRVGEPLPKPQTGCHTSIRMPCMRSIAIVSPSGTTLALHPTCGTACTSACWRWGC